jgi:hypothetical protein
MPYSDPEKQKAARQAYYLANREQRIAAMKASKTKRKKALQAYKEANPCTDCGVFYPYYVMQLDHLPGFEKIESLASLINKVSMERVWEEVAKCELVCANCHAIRTHKRSSEASPGN